jgi:hypothetical protein
MRNQHHAENPQRLAGARQFCSLFCGSGVRLGQWGQLGLFLLSDGWVSSYSDASGFITQGHWALSPQITEMGFDLAWNQGVHQLCGLGVALWYLPFVGWASTWNPMPGYHPFDGGSIFTLSLYLADDVHDNTAGSHSFPRPALRFSDSLLPSLA